MPDDKNTVKRIEKREEYWNEKYANYWISRVDEANNEEISSSQIIKADTKTSKNAIYSDAISLLDITKTDKVIEIGVGFGRSLPELCQAAHHVTALDISAPMIAIAKARTKENNLSFYVSPSEKTPFDSNVFDVAVCFASFDAMYQTEALIEINRICKKGARVLITGKNDNYYDDDNLAMEAESEARKKGHPNYFTDVRKLLNNSDKFGFRIDIQQFYPKRGDFGLCDVLTQMPSMFYEFLIVSCKVSQCSVGADFLISSDVSKTYNRNYSRS